MKTNQQPAKGDLLVRDVFLWPLYEIWEYENGAANKSVYHNKNDDVCFRIMKCRAIFTLIKAMINSSQL